MPLHDQIDSLSERIIAAQPNAPNWGLEGERLLPREVARLCWAAGWVQQDRLVEAVAIAQAESQFWTKAWHRNSPTSIDLGLFQINSMHMKGFGYSDEAKWRAACFDPVTNVRFARRLYVDAKYTFKPWVAFTGGHHRKYLGNAVIGAANAQAVRLGLSPVPYTRRA
jgi:hypothetical protein